MNRRIIFAIAFVILFALGVIVWFFIYAQPKSSPSLGGTVNPLLPSNFPKKFQFIFNNDEQVSTSTTEVTLAKPEVLTEIWNKPATGQTFITEDILKEVDATSTKGTTTISIKKLVHSTSTILMFVDRTTGYIYGYNRELGKVYQISNTTIPGIYDAYIFNNGKRIVLRYADNDKKIIVGVLANIPSVNEKEQAKPLENTTNLPAQVTSVAVNKKGNLLSYLVTGENGGGAIYTLSDKGALLIANTPFKEWSLNYGGDTLYATSKPSAYVDGQTVRLPSFEFIVGGKTGLMSVPGEDGLTLNSMWSSSGLKTFVSNLNKQNVLNISTIASKCAWGQKDFLVCAVPKTLPKSVEGMPDDWFQGRVLFDDSLMVLDNNSNQMYPFYSFKTPDNLIFDVTGISFSQENTFIAFNRKQNSSLWLLDTNLLRAE